MTKQIKHFQNKNKIIMRGGGKPTKEDFKKYSVSEQRGSGGTTPPVTAPPTTTPPATTPPATTPPATTPPSTDIWACINAFNKNKNYNPLNDGSKPDRKWEYMSDIDGKKTYYVYLEKRVHHNYEEGDVKIKSGNWICDGNDGYTITWDDGSKSFFSSKTTSQNSCSSWNKNDATIDDLKNKKKVVKKCDKGEIVTTIQKRLKTYYKNELGGVFDTKFGDKTESAVKKFQLKMGLKDDGIVGDKTAKALFPETQSTGTTQSSDLRYSGGLKPEIESQAKDSGDLQQSEDDLFWKDEATKKKYMENKTNLQNENNMRRLKDNIKQKLIETKFNKDKILSEQKVVKKRFSLIFEKNEKLTINEISNRFIYEMFYLDSQKYSNTVINEETKKFFDTFKALLGDDKLELMSDNLKEKMYNYLLTKLKISKNDSFGISLKKIIKSVPTQEIPKLFIDCGYLSNKLSKKIPIDLIGKVQSSEFDGPVVSLVKDLITSEMGDNEFSEKVSTGLHKLLCPIIDNMRNNLETVFKDVKRRALNI